MRHHARNSILAHRMHFNRQRYTSTIAFYDANVQSASDYYAFGQLLPGRNTGENYRYGFNGMEEDNETKGEGNSYTTEFRQYDPRIGRWLSLDPKTHHEYSPYSAFDNNPVYYVDPDGRDIILAGTNDEKKASLAELQKLTNDKLTYDLNSGVVTIAKMGGENPNKTLSTGTELINDLINHKNDVIINIVLTGSSEKNANDANAINGVGTDTRVNLDLNQSGIVWTKDPQSGLVSKQETTDEIKLGHELIHAYRAMEGKQIDYKETECYTFEKKPGIKTDRIERTEELQTVGLSGEGKYSENKLREEQGLGERVAY
jgi:RHS repeat-associated protein